MIGKNSPLDRVRKRERLSLRSEPARPNGRHGVGGRRSGPTQPRRERLSLEEERLLQQILAEPMDYIDSKAFYVDDAEDRIYAQAPDVAKPDVTWYRPLMDDLSPSDERSLRQTAPLLLTGAEERILFLQYNYARHRVASIQERLGLDQPTEAEARELLHWYGIAKGYREQIAETNLALVLAMAKRTRMSEVDFADLVSEGNMALLRSVDKFDCGRGFKFSTYACRAILKAFSRQGMKLSKYRQRFPTDFDPAMEKSNHLETIRDVHVRETAAEVKHIVLTNEADLTDVERTVIHHRFGLEGGEKAVALTLEQVGQIIGVTKERVRQIQNKALEKIRTALEINLREIDEAEAERRNGGGAEAADEPAATRLEQPTDN
jgi:RNA polymerase sigma factor (sigma-70 family)